ncbi:hypothetical protein AB9Q52_005800 [Pantoea vagans]|uniref:hypothetical protein n=1 Tax=Pantoea vagans TaxID=470934 RepID=UPI00351224C9
MSISNSRYTITLVCIPHEYLPFPLSFIKNSRYYISEFCGNDHFTVFLISDKNSNAPARIFYSVKSVAKEYEVLTGKKFDEKELLRLHLQLDEDWLKLSSDSRHFELIYNDVYFNDEKELEENKNKLIKPIMSIRLAFLKDLEEELNREIEKIKKIAEKAILNDDIRLQNDIVRKRLYLKNK